MYPFGASLRAGARLAFGSDWTVSTADPLPQLEVAVTRVYAPTRATPSRCSPRRGSTCRPRSDAFTDRLGLRQLPRRRDRARSRPASSPTWSCSTATSSIPASGPIGDARVLLTLVEGEAVYADPGLGW